MAGFMAHSEKFWLGNNYEIGLPLNATEPCGWRRACYEDALKNAPSDAAREKLVADNAFWQGETDY